jgi:DNA-binding transcriptional ArsR family regulator
MELDGLFSSPKWKLIEEISLNPQSPMQLAEKMVTSVANISQQLRLLEVAGLVKKKRVSERAKGKPRVIFSINNNFCYLLAATEGFAKKRILNLGEYHLPILKILLIDDVLLHEELMDFYFRLKPFLEKVDAVFIRNQELVVLIKSGYSGPKEFNMVKRLKFVMEQSKGTNMRDASAPESYSLFLRKPTEKEEKKAER